MKHLDIELAFLEQRIDLASKVISSKIKAAKAEAVEATHREVRHAQAIGDARAALTAFRRLLPFPLSARYRWSHSRMGRWQQIQLNVSPGGFVTSAV